MSAKSRGKLVQQVRHEAAERAQGERRPLGAYLGGMTIYSGVVLGLGALARNRRRTLPTPSPFEVLLITAATHKLARLVSKESITSALRAPFTRYQGVAGPAELAEDVRDDDGPLRHAVGELLTCPFCLAQWTATGFAYGLVFAPQTTRLVAMTLTAVAGADFLQLGYAWAQHKAESPGQ
ncbi:MAG: DUF1360 domain-containing protein [Ferruginibacter sp.]